MRKVDPLLVLILGAVAAFGIFIVYSHAAFREDCDKRGGHTMSMGAYAKSLCVSSDGRIIE